MNQLRCKVISALLTFVFLAVSSVLAAAPAAAADVATISGTLVTQDNGLPVSNATVTLYQGTTVAGTTTSDTGGQYTFSKEPAGVYSIVIRATGYQTTRVDDIFATAGTVSAIRTPLLRAETNSGSLREIGAVSATARGTTLASSSTIQHDLSPLQLQSQGFFKAADALGQVPGVNLSGGPHTVGDDTIIDIRGMGSGEVRPLLDGHPLGPIGVFSPDFFNYANSGYFLMSNIQITVGSGASGLYGVDVIGGTIDFQTLNPTRTPHAELYQGFGSANTLISQVKSTGSVGRFGYAIGHTVSGTTGDFSPGLVFQGARPNNNLNLPNNGACTASNDLTSCNTALNTYSVSGNYRVQNDLLKLQYSLGDKSAVSFTAYGGNQLSDSTGNGDNDNIPYDTRLAEIQAQPQNCPVGYTVITNSNPNACYTAQQWAAASYGPYGGGADRNRGTSIQDYHARFTTLIGTSNNVTIDAFDSFYDYRKNSNQAAGFDPTGTYYVGGGTFDDNYLSNGLLVSDDIALANNDFGIGYFVEHQREWGNNFTQGPPPAYVPQSERGAGDYSFFVRDQFIADQHFSLYANAWLRRSIVTAQTTFDPRLSLVFRPTRNDVVRLTGGRADGDPAAAIKSTGSFSSYNNPSSLNPSSFAAQQRRQRRQPEPKAGVVERL